MKTLTTLFLSLMSSILIAQIPNASFESWTGSNPDSWTFTGTVIQSVTAHAGYYAAQLNADSLNPASTTLTTGNTQTIYVPYSGNFDTVYGWYMLDIASPDSLTMQVKTKCAPNISNGNAVWTTKVNTLVYKQFKARVNYGSCTSDSLTITFSLTNQSLSGSAYAIIDDLAPANNITGLDEKSNDVTIGNAFPNPASTTCNIIYSVPTDATVNVSLYDISGRLIKTLLTNTQQSPGRYKMPIDVSNIPRGIYMYRVLLNNQAYTQKLVIAKN